MMPLEALFAKLRLACLQAWRETLVQVRQKLVGREAEMSAWAQELYDDIGKARADLAIAHR